MDRLRRARRRQYRRQIDFCRKFGFAYSTYSGNERERPYSLELAARYAHALGEDPWWLLTGERRSAPLRLPIMSHAGAGEAVVPFDDGPYDTLDFSEFDGHHIVSVQGNSMSPTYRKGDLIIINPQDKRAPGDAVRRDCVVAMADGTQYLKRVERGAGDTFDLISYHPDHPPIEGEPIDWVTPVVAVVRRS